MGKKIKSREAHKRAAEAAISARLCAHSRVDTGPAFITSFGEFAPGYRAKVEAFRACALRPPELWRCRLRSRAPEKRFLELVRFTFARYRVPAHLENVWIEDAHALAAHRGAGHDGDRDTDWNHYFRSWYIVATQGGSLYRQAGARNYMTNLETHHFLTAPEEVTSVMQAFWYAFARAHSDVHTALRVSRTKLVAFPIQHEFWKDAARFFARNPTSILEMNDLIDFFQAAREQDESFSLSRRTLPALRVRMAEWHRTLRKRALVCGGRWDGAALPDVRYDAGSGHEAAIWRFRQIKTGDELFKEGQRMHHCVVTYKFRCMRAEASIWSLTCEYPLGRLNRGVTLELRADGAIVQCRGFANRRPHGNEIAMVKRWAAEHGLVWMADE